MIKTSIPYIYNNLGKEKSACLVPGNCRSCPFNLNPLNRCKYKISILSIEEASRVLVKHFPNLLLLEEGEESV